MNLISSPSRWDFWRGEFFREVSYFGASIFSVKRWIDAGHPGSLKPLTELFSQPLKGISDFILKSGPSDTSKAIIQSNSFASTD